jgi:hypothetical protein
VCNSGCRVALATVFCAVAPKIYGSSIWNVLDVTNLVTDFEFDPIFLKNMCTPGECHVFLS